MAVRGKALTLFLTAMLGTGTIPAQVQHVTTHGGGPLHTNWYEQSSPPWLCLDWDSASAGRSYTQPLLVRDNVYALAGNKLYRFDLQGRQIGAMTFAGRDSKGQLTYHVGRTPAEDLLFVPTPGPPYGIVMIQPQEIVGEVRFTDRLLWKSSNGAYVVSAPLYFPKLEAIVFGSAGGTGGDHIWLVSTGGKFPKYYYPPVGEAGWVSGSPVQVGSSQFVIGDKNGLRRLTITESGLLESGEKDLLKTIPADVNGAVLSAVSAGGVDGTGFPTVVYAIDKIGNIYRVNTKAGPRLVDQWADLPEHPQTTGFSNSGPALDDKYVYLPIRWPLPKSYRGNATYPDAKPWFGSMTAFDKSTGEQVWSQALKAAHAVPGQAKPSWVNQPPIVFGGGRNEDQSLKQRVVLAGDAGGRVWAWDGSGEPMPFALVDDQQLPIACESLEGPEPPSTVHYSAVASLTARPHVITDPAWSNQSGVAIGLMFARDRLLTGVNEKNDAGAVQSRLVALRSGTNAWIQSMTFWQNGEERAQERLDPGQPAIAKVTAAWSVTGAGRTLAPLQVYAGWSDQSVGAAQTVTPTGSLGQQTLEFEVPARTDIRTGRVAAVLNPGLVMRRQPKEEGAAPIPDQWRSTFAEAALDANLTNRGEVLVGDNLMTQTMGATSPPAARLWISPTNACTGQEIKYNPSYWDPQGLRRAAEEAEPFGWPPPARFDKPTSVNIRYRAQNTAGTWSVWAEQPLTVRDCTKPPPLPPSVSFAVGFDPAIGHRGHRINMQVEVQRQDEIADHKLTEFTVSEVTVTLPDELRDLRSCVPYQPCWEAPNDDVDAEGSDLEWHYSFDLPAPGTTPADGSYSITVAAKGTYTWDHWHDDLRWHENLVDVCNTDPATGQPSCQPVDQGEWVDHGKFHPHTENWSASEQVVFAVTGGHQFVHPATDHD